MYNIHIVHPAYQVIFVNKKLKQSIYIPFFLNIPMRNNESESWTNISSTLASTAYSGKKTIASADIDLPNNFKRR